MQIPAQINIDLGERFPHLTCAPIVEAVIHWQARSENLESVEGIIRAELPNYPSHQTQRTATFTMDLAVDSASQETVAYWDGFRLVSEDRRKIARFARNGFAFSQIAPYGNWERFASEAKRLWGIFVAHANPVQVERLGVRFINRVSRVSIESLDRVLRFPPPNLDRPSLPLEEFLNRSLYKVPGHPFRVNVTQTTQPVLSSDENAPALIVDIDVFMTATIEPMSSSLDDRLEEMRWLKNKVFFSVFSDEAINRFSGIDK